MVVQMEREGIGDNGQHTEEKEGPMRGLGQYARVVKDLDCKRYHSISNIRISVYIMDGQGITCKRTRLK